MAVLGIQFVITLAMATVLSRVGPHLSLARWGGSGGGGLVASTMYNVHPLPALL